MAKVRSEDGTDAATWDAYWRDYEADGYVNEVPRMIEALEAHIPLKGCRVLEVGSGTGGTARALAMRGAQVTALDFSSAAIARSHVSALQAGQAVACVQGDARAMPFEPAAFDLIFHQGFLEHFHDPTPIVIEQRRVLNRGGWILVDVPQRYNLYTIYKHHLMRRGQWPYGGWEREFSFGELCTLLECNGFEVVASYGRGYFPRAFEMLHNLPKAEQKLLGTQLLPAQAWDPWRDAWQKFEQTSWAARTMQSVGVLARAF